MCSDQGVYQLRGGLSKVLGLPVEKIRVQCYPGSNTYGSSCFVHQINEKSSGAGEEVLPAVVAAIGNAFFDATGVRLREFPLTPSRVLAALKAARTRGHA